ncbi:hypothetical protein HK100_002924 [Physocladia obscura]|uniref:Uncharacterized protein n=1 Tax=Physocladia obscura TaxID=109957 RepID=A0AAD5SUX7_9FUNG|nr:hypothetical protein HK100_002924 [Physocladia obscura]
MATSVTASETTGNSDSSFSLALKHKKLHGTVRFQIPGVQLPSPTPSSSISNHLHRRRVQQQQQQQYQYQLNQHRHHNREQAFQNNSATITRRQLATTTASLPLLSTVTMRELPHLAANVVIVGPAESTSMQHHISSSLPKRPVRAFLSSKGIMRNSWATLAELRQKYLRQIEQEQRQDHNSHGGRNNSVDSLTVQNTRENYRLRGRENTTCCNDDMRSGCGGEGSSNNSSLGHDGAESIGKLRMKVWPRCMFWVVLCVCGVLVCSVIVVLVYWKVVLPRILQNMFSSWNLLENHALSGFEEFVVTGYDPQGLAASILFNCGGFNSSMGKSAEVSSGSQWTIQFSIDDATTWKPIISIPSLPSSIKVENNHVLFNASDTNIEVLNAKNLKEFVQLLSTNETTPNMKLKVSLLADVSVAHGLFGGSLFYLQGLLLENIVSLNNSSAGNSSLADTSHAANFTYAAITKTTTTTTATIPTISTTTTVSSRFENRFISELAFDPLVSIANNTITSVLNIGINGGNISSSGGSVSSAVNTVVMNVSTNATEGGAEMGSILQIPDVFLVTFSVFVDGQEALAGKMPILGVSLWQTVIHVPIGFKAATNTKLTESEMLALASRITESGGQVALANWDIGGITGVDAVPRWVSEMLEGFYVVIVIGGKSGDRIGAVIGDLVEQVLKRVA